mmetsp:Transcript_1720/g.3175  ORF Transcript_1720/g.3175 Transcript_1720/m.3175 type:complete len:228 (-) Transcript_1720:1996-2679(-)
MRRRKRNCAMAMSLASLASTPSSPTMPTPTCAACIIPTSLAPSPMARVTLRLSFLLTSSTSSVFWRGVTLHAITTLATSLRSANFRSRRGWRAKTRVPPSTTNPKCFPSCPSCMRAVQRPIVQSIWACVSSMFVSFSRTTSISSSNKPHDNPILMAVSCLSPVRIHILIPARSRSTRVSGTSSCNLSSIAVAPMSVKFCSTNANAFSMAWSRPCSCPRAPVYTRIHS